jgi:hypothetical protein
MQEERRRSQQSIAGARDVVWFVVIRVGGDTKTEDAPAETRTRYERLLTTRKTGNAGAIVANSAIGASLFTGIWGRVPGARCRYALKMGARWSLGTSFRVVFGSETKRSTEQREAVISEKTY